MTPAPVAVWRRALLDDNSLSSSEKLVALVVHDYWDISGTCAPWGSPPRPGAGPSYESIARQACLSTRTVIRIMRRLEETGWIICSHRSRGRGSNRYLMPGAKKTQPHRRKAVTRHERATDLAELR